MLLPLASIPFPSFGFSSPGSDGKTGFIVIFLFAFCLHILSSRTTLVCVKKLERNNKRRLQECPCDVKMLFLGSKKENERNHKNNTFEEPWKMGKLISRAATSFRFEEGSFDAWRGCRTFPSAISWPISNRIRASRLIKTLWMKGAKRRARLVPEVCAGNLDLRCD